MMHVSAGLRSAQATPLRSRTGAPLGMLNTHWKESGYRPSDDQLRFLDLLARQAADLIEQRQAQESLRQSEEKYRTLFETIDEGFTIMEAVRDDAGRVVDVIYRQANQAWARLFGFEVELGRKASEVFSYPATAPWIETWNQVLETGEPVREEQYVVSTDRWYNVRFSRIGSAGSDLIAAVFDDITEQKRAELTLRESEAKLADDLRAAEALQALSSQLIKDGAAEEFFESILEVGMTIMQADFGRI